MQRGSKTKDTLTNKSPKVVSWREVTVGQESNFLPLCPNTHPLTKVWPLLLSQTFARGFFSAVWMPFFRCALQFSLSFELLLEVHMWELSKNQNPTAFYNNFHLLIDKKLQLLDPFLTVHVILMLPISFISLSGLFGFVGFQALMHCSIRKEADIPWLLSIGKMTRWKHNTTVELTPVAF